MSLILRLARWLGMDTTTQVEDTRSMFEYTIEQTNGEITTMQANGIKREDGMVRLYKYSKPFPVNIFGPNFWLLDETVFECGASTILSIEREKVAEETWVATFDRADGEMLEWKIA